MKKSALLIVVISLLMSSTVYAFTSNLFSTATVRASHQFWSITNAAQTGLHIGSPNSAYTQCAWVNLNTTGINQGITVKSDDTVAHFEYWFQIASDNKLQTDIVDSDGGFAVSGHWQRYKTDSAVNGSTGTWYHDCVTVDFNSGSPVVVFYVNGSSVASSKTNGTTIGSTAFASGANSVGVAWGALLDASDYIDGKVDDVVLANTAFSSTKISSLYTTPCTFTDVSIQGRWLFENNSNDSTANANNLTNNNVATFSSTVPYTCAASGPPLWSAGFP